ncbi:MAG: VCBS repeat-containing protein, partial [Planctomycetota bacterium]
ARHDFNDDGKDDFLWTSSTKRATIWLMDGTELTNLTAQQNVPQGARFGGIQAGSDNPRANAEVTWNFRRGTLVWQMNNGNLQRVDRSGITSRPNPAPTASTNTAATSSTNDGYRIVLNADLDGDGRNDRVWQNAATSSAEVRYANGLIREAPTTESWLSPRPARDIDGDGDLDVEWFDNDRLFLEWRFEDGLLDSVYYPVFRNDNGSLSPRSVGFTPEGNYNPTDSVENIQDLGLVLTNWGAAHGSVDPGGETFSRDNVDPEELLRVLNNWAAKPAPSFLNY